MGPGLCDSDGNPHLEISDSGEKPSFQSWDSKSQENELLAGDLQVVRDKGICIQGALFLPHCGPGTRRASGCVSCVRS